MFVIPVKNEGLQSVDCVIDSDMTRWFFMWGLNGLIQGLFLVRLVYAVYSSAKLATFYPFVGEKGAELNLIQRRLPDV